MSTIRGTVVAALAAATCATPLPCALAADNPDALNLQRITVTATRGPLSTLDSPAIVHTRDAVELRMQRQVRTTPESLRELPGVMVQKTGHGQGSPYIRGFTGFRTLFLIDGIRLNNSTFRDGPNQYWNTVDPLSIETLELVKGPVSVLYGSDAIGGTANAITLDPEDVAGDKLTTRLLYRYAGAERAGTGRVEAARVYDNGFGMLAGLSLKDFGDLRSGAGTYPMTGYREDDIDTKLTFSGSAGRWTLAHQRVDLDDAWRTHRTVFGRSFAGTTVGNEKQRSLDQHRRLSYLRYAANEAGPLDRLEVTVSRHDQGEDRLRIRSDDRRDETGTDVASTGLSFVAGHRGLGRWDYGIEYYRDDVDSYRRDFNADGSLRAIGIQGPVGDDARYHTGGAFVQNSFAFGDVDWVFGARYTYAAAQANAVRDPVDGSAIRIADHWNALAGSVRGVYRPADANWSLFGGVSQGFRAPNLSDLTRFDTARSNEIEVPVENLDPERFVNYELGAKVARGSWTGQGAVFYTSIDKLIARTPTGRVIDGDNEITKRNSGAGHVRGFEAQWNYTIGGGFDLLGAFTWLDGEVGTYPTSAPELVVEPIDRLMPATAMTGLRWHQPGASGWAELSVVHAADADRLSSRDRGDTQRIPPGGTPGYTVAHLRGGLRIGAALDLALALENLGGRDYRVHGSGVNEPGRNLLMTLSWRPER